MHKSITRAIERDSHFGHITISIIAIEEPREYPGRPAVALSGHDTSLSNSESDRVFSQEPADDLKLLGFSSRSGPLRCRQDRTVDEELSIDASSVIRDLAARKKPAFTLAQLAGEIEPHLGISDLEPTSFGLDGDAIGLAERKQIVKAIGDLILLGVISAHDDVQEITGERRLESALLPRNLQSR
ncbi:MAG TPA: hypothetical protein VII12_12295 [Thermoanaerobaculia bacterium]